MASELKPCPFCQYKAHEWIQGNKKMACCDNMDCPCRAIVCTVEQWNTRPAPAATDTGLVTVAWESMDNKSDPNDKLVYEVKFPRNGDKRLVYQSQAVELLAAERARAAEKERLRFEGDLDKWMKIIGAGITGYQPEAYALMDLACHELVKLRSDISAIAGHVDCEADSDSILHIIRELEADNAAQAARINGFEGFLDDLAEILGCERDIGDVVNEIDAINNRAEVLEAKLEAAERALEQLRSDCQTPIDMYERNGPEFTSPHGNEYESTSYVMAKFAELVASIDEARAVLGGKLS